MITYERLKRDEGIAPSLIGMTLAAFDELYGQFEATYQRRLMERWLTKRTSTLRRRAAGAGAPYRYDLRDRLLMTLFWRRVHTTYAVIGFFYELNATNVEDNIKDVLATLEQLDEQCTLVGATARRVKLRSPEAVMAAIPELRLLMDAKA